MTDAHSQQCIADIYRTMTRVGDEHMLPPDCVCTLRKTFVDGLSEDTLGHFATLVCGAVTAGTESETAVKDAFDVMSVDKEIHDEIIREFDEKRYITFAAMIRRMTMTSRLPMLIRSNVSPTSTTR